MVKALLLLAVVFVVMIYPFSVLAVYAEVLIRGGTLALGNTMQLTTFFWPFSLIQGKGISWGLAIGAGLAAVVAQYFYHEFLVKRWGWVSEKQYQQLMGRGKQ